MIQLIVAISLVGLLILQGLFLGGKHTSLDGLIEFGVRKQTKLGHLYVDPIHGVLILDVDLFEHELGKGFEPHVFANRFDLRTQEVVEEDAASFVKGFDKHLGLDRGVGKLLFAKELVAQSLANVFVDLFVLTLAE